MRNINIYVDKINEEYCKIAGLNKAYINVKEKFDKYINDYKNLDLKNDEFEIYKLSEIPYSELNVNVDDEIKELENELETLIDKKRRLLDIISRKEKKLKDKLNKEKKIKQNLPYLNDAIEGYNKELRIEKSKIYEKNKEKVECIEKFVIRRLFVEYTEALLKEYKSDDNEVVKAFIYNTGKSIEKIKNDEDNWMLGKNSIEKIKKNILNKETNINLSDSKCIAKAILNFDNYNNFKDYIVKMYQNKSLRTNINSNDEIIKIQEKIDILILDFIDTVNESDIVLNNLESIKFYEDIISRLGYEEIELKELDRLDTELCTTLETQNTDDIEKDFTISKIHRKGYKSKEKVLRRTIVDVYRFVPCE